MAPSSHGGFPISHYRAGACVHQIRPRQLNRALGTTETTSTRSLAAWSGTPCVQTSWSERNRGGGRVCAVWSAKTRRFPSSRRGLCLAPPIGCKLSTNRKRKPKWRRCVAASIAVGPSAILTGSRTRPSDWGWNRRFGPVEDRRNNRRLATVTARCPLFFLLYSPNLVAVSFLVADNTVSIHAPAKGRLTMGIKTSPHVVVSIHAPAKGRRTRVDEDVWTDWFQSTPPRRGDRRRQHGLRPDRRFQSTPPRRGDHPCSFRSSHRPRFQSTPPRRGDNIAGGWNKLAWKVSIHAPAKGRLGMIAWT